MMPSGGIGRWVSIIVITMVVVAVWKANNGDVSAIVSAVWNFINAGAQVMLDLWDRFIGSGEFQRVLNSTTGSTA